MMLTDFTSTTSTDQSTTQMIEVPLWDLWRALAVAIVNNPPPQHKDSINLLRKMCLQHLGFKDV